MLLQVVIIAPNGAKHQVKSADEGARFMHIISNGYMDIEVKTLTDNLAAGAAYEFGGWRVSTLEQDVPSNMKVGYQLTKGDKLEIVHTAEAIAHVCDCTINTVVKRLEATPEGFTVKGWTVSRK